MRTNNFYVTKEQDIVALKNDMVAAMRAWFEKNGKGCKAVIGISGGKDSSVVAALAVEALGVNNVFGVLMPDGDQKDIDMSHALVSFLGIDHALINISETKEAFLKGIEWAVGTASNLTLTNLNPRIRMATLYGISQSINGRVLNTCNLSEEIVGYSTRWGDDTGDYAPLRDLFVSEVIAVGRALGLPEEFVTKVPADGLNCDVNGHQISDEDVLGFTYDDIEKFALRLNEEGFVGDTEVERRIYAKYIATEFKRNPIAQFNKRDL